MEIEVEKIIKGMGIKKYGFYYKDTLENVASKIGKAPDDKELKGSFYRVIKKMGLKFFNKDEFERPDFKENREIFKRWMNKW